MSEPYKYEVDIKPYNGQLADLWIWCDQHFSKKSWVWNVSSFAFVNEKDAALFALKWAK